MQGPSLWISLSTATDNVMARSETKGPCSVDCIIFGPILASATPALETSDRGTVVVDPDAGETSIPGVFAGGDITSGGATVILALAAGRTSAAAIDEWLGQQA